MHISSFLSLIFHYRHVLQRKNTQILGRFYRRCNFRVICFFLRELGNDQRDGPVVAVTAGIVQRLSLRHGGRCELRGVPVPGSLRAVVRHHARRLRPGLPPLAWASVASRAPPIQLLTGRSRQPMSLKFISPNPILP